MGVWYPRIARILGLSVEADTQAARLLEELSDDVRTCEDVARRMIEGRTCVVFGAGPTLRDSFDQMRLEGCVSVAAEGAAKTFQERGRPPTNVLETDHEGGDDVI